MYNREGERGLFCHSICLRSLFAEHSQPERESLAELFSQVGISRGVVCKRNAWRERGCCSMVSFCPHVFQHLWESKLLFEQDLGILCWLPQVPHRNGLLVDDNVNN